MRQVHDGWLLPTLETLLNREDVEALKLEVTESLWDAVIRANLITNTDLLTALSQRFRLPVADLSAVSVTAKALVPETLARKYRILPLSCTDTTLDHCDPLLVMCVDCIVNGDCGTLATCIAGVCTPL